MSDSLPGLVKDSVRLAVRDHPNDFDFEDGVKASILFVLASTGLFVVAAAGIYGGHYAWDTGLISTETANLLAGIVHWGVGGVLVVSLALSFASIGKCLWWLHATDLREVSTPR